MVATRRLLKLKQPPDALFCTNDHLALAALQVARTEFGLEPGKDLSIVGFDNVTIADWPAFGLTSYSQPQAEIAARIVEVVCQLLSPDTQPPLVHERIAGELLVRTSARIPSSGILTLTGGQRVWRMDPKAVGKR